MPCVEYYCPAGLWYCAGMKRVSTPRSNTRGKTGGATIGRKAFAKISAVEGIRLTPEMKQRAAEFDRKGLSPEERVRAIVATHRKG
jgi:hypothetical protein